MTQYKFVFTASLFFIIMSCCSQNRQETSVVGIFEASTPCSQASRPLPGIPGNADCKLIKWKLTLYQDKVSKAPTTYALHCLYGLPDQGTTGLTDGGREAEMEGNWTIIKGKTTFPNAMLYRLEDRNTGKSISFVKLNDRLLHLLDSDQRLMIGSAAWSYTLNRVDNE